MEYNSCNVQLAVISNGNKTEGLDEYNAQWEALVKLKKSYDIDFWEVRP